MSPALMRFVFNFVTEGTLKVCSKLPLGCHACWNANGVLSPQNSTSEDTSYCLFLHIHKSQMSSVRGKSPPLTHIFLWTTLAFRLKISTSNLQMMTRTKYTRPWSLQTSRKRNGPFHFSSTSSRKASKTIRRGHLDDKAVLDIGDSTLSSLFPSSPKLVVNEIVQEESLTFCWAGGSGMRGLEL